MCHDKQSKTSDKPVAYRVRWVVPVDRPPIEGGIVTIAGGRIVDVGENTSGSRRATWAMWRYCRAGQRSHASGVQPAARSRWGSREWRFRIGLPASCSIGASRTRRCSSRPTAFSDFGGGPPRPAWPSCTIGAVAAVGDIATPAGRASVFRPRGLMRRCFSNCSVWSRTSRTTCWRWRGVLCSMCRMQPAGCGRAQPACAVHVRARELVQQVCQLSAAERFPVAMHLAESRKSWSYWRPIRGRIVEVLDSASKPGNRRLFRRGLRPLDYLQRLATAHRALVIHGNYLTTRRNRIPRGTPRPHVGRLLPRTHAYFGHEPYPLAEMLAAGVRVAVGTDSRASNPDLRLLEELRHIARHHPDVSPDDDLADGHARRCRGARNRREYRQHHAGKAGSDGSCRVAVPSKTTA